MLLKILDFFYKNVDVCYELLVLLTGYLSMDPDSGRVLPKQTWSKQPPSVFIPVESPVAS